MLSERQTLVQAPPQPLDESISNCVRALALLDGAAAMTAPGSSQRTLVLEARAIVFVLRDRLERWLAVSEEAKRDHAQAGKHIGGGAL